VALGVKFCGECGARVGGEASAERRTAEPDTGERRQLTVLFCDLVGWTELAGQLDPEEWQQLVRAYRDAAAETVRALRRPRRAGSPRASTPST
jgi:class 3 adenylate cyclase